MNKATAIRWSIVALAVATLELACNLRWIDPTAVIPPSAMALGAWKILQLAEWQQAIVETLTTVAIAILLSAIVGVFAGWGLTRAPRLRRAVDPLLASWYAIPTFVFYPLFIVLFGLGRWPLVAIGFLFAVVAMMLGTIQGVERVPRTLLRTAEAMRLTRTQTLLRVTLPAAAPWLFAGLKLVVAYAFIGVVAGEFVLANEGFGHRIAFAYNNFDNRAMYGAILLLLVFVAALNGTLAGWEKKLLARRGLR
ncbi:MAG: nitrate transporter permease [Rhodospirillales bacterium]|nr:nitrate transporter permease [Rhodospirillales bacterium]